jgi:hypothetical protein
MSAIKESLKNVLIKLNEFVPSAQSMDICQRCQIWPSTYPHTAEIGKHNYKPEIPEISYDDCNPLIALMWLP